MVDDLGWNHIGVDQGTMGTHGKQYVTPNLAQLAKEGLSFTHAYAQPNCAPTRAAMLSGQYPARIHNDVYVVGNLNRNGRGGISKEKAKFVGPKQSEDVAAEAITIAEALKKNGYATAHIGKYHVGGHGGEATMPENVGFDIYYYEADAWELYCLSDDQGEEANLIKSKPEIASALSGKINTWLTQQHPTWKPKYPIVKASGQPAGPPPRYIK